MLFCCYGQFHRQPFAGRPVSLPQIRIYFHRVDAELPAVGACSRGTSGGSKKGFDQFSIDARNALFIRILCCFCDALLGTNLERL